MTTPSPKNCYTIAYTEIVSLSHPIDPNIPIWPGDPPVEFEAIADLQQDGYYLRKFSIGEHSATHINAPNSFFPEGLSIDRYPPTALVFPATVIDISDRCLTNPDYAFSLDDVRNWEKQYEPIAPNNLIFVYTGWQAKWNDSQAFFNQDSWGNMHFPGLSDEGVKFLLEERGIAGVGIDTHGVDRGLDRDFTVNKRLLSQAKIVLENLTNLDRLPSTGTTVTIGVLGLRGGSGSPVSVLAFIP